MSDGRCGVEAHFVHHFGLAPRWIVRAPGRVNLIGEHTDYNDGFVLPLAIDRAVWIALRPRNDRRVLVHSVDFQQAGEFSLDDLRPQQAGWIEYLKGTAWALQDAGLRLTGWEGVLQGDVPLGAGLSSSAALEMATARAFAAAGNLDWQPAPMATLGQRAENKWVGVNCGIMDQLISAAGRACHALLIDCRSLETQPVPFPPGRGGRRAGYDDAPRPGRFGVQRAALAMRGGCPVLPRAGLARRDDRAVRSPGRRPGCRDAATRPARDYGKRPHVAGGRRHASWRCRHAGPPDGREPPKLRDDYEVSSDALNAMVQCRGGPRSLLWRTDDGGRLRRLRRGPDSCRMPPRISSAARRPHTSKTTGLAPAAYVCQATNGAEVVGE